MPCSPARRMASWRSPVQSSRCSTVCGHTSTPASRKTSFPSRLSIATAAAATPPPTYGMPLSSSAPSRLPSSPPVPWMELIAASTWRSRSPLKRDPPGAAKGAPSRPRRSSQGSARAGASRPNAPMSRRASPVHQRPSRARYTGTGSCFGSITAISCCALMMETSCSTDGPPNRTATRSPCCVIAAGTLMARGAVAVFGVQVRQVVLEQHHVAAAGGLGEERLGLGGVRDHVDALVWQIGGREAGPDRQRAPLAHEDHEVAHGRRLLAEALVLLGLAVAELD